MDHADVMNSCDEKAQQLGLDSLSDSERVVVLVAQINFEFELGGLSGFFYNSAGDHAIETVPALEAVDAVEAVKALRAAIAMIPEDAVRDREQRHDAWEQVSDEAIDQLDSAFSEDDPDVFARLCTYIESHSSQLAEHM